MVGIMHEWNFESQDSHARMDTIDAGNFEV